jgi:hypothetical protein
MVRLRFVRFVFATCVIGAVLSGCSEAGSPIGAPITQGMSRSWMTPTAKKNGLLYISDAFGDFVNVYSYPKGQLVGTLTGFGLPLGECADTQGDVYVVDSANGVVDEYAHGGTSPIATFNAARKGLLGCSVDPLTGNLAVTSLYTASLSSELVVFPAGQHDKPTGYLDSKIYDMSFCGYDNAGNLFVDGYSSPSGGFQLAELPYGGDTLTNLTLRPADELTSPGNVQWDRHFLAVGNSTDVIYQIAINPSEQVAYIVGSTPLNGAEDVVQFWVQGKRVVGPDAQEALVYFWRYPKGGTPLNYLSGGGLAEPFGAAVSFVPK